MRVTVMGPQSLADALAAQGADVRLLADRAGRAESAALGQLLIAYADDRIDAANATAVEHLQTSRPVLAGVAPAGLLLDVPRPRWLLVGGPHRDWQRLCDAQRRAAAATCVLEGWADDSPAAEALLREGEIPLAPALAAGAVAPGAMVIGPSSPCWLVRDDATGRTAVAPVLHGGPAIWRGDVSAEAMRRARVLAETAGPAMAAALRAGGPLDVYAHCEEALAMGDDCHARTPALSLLVMRDLLPALTERAPRAVHAVALLAPGDGLGLSVAAGAARASLAGLPADPACSLLTCVAGDADGVAIQLAAMPDRWFTAPSPAPVDATGRAMNHCGDAAITELVGLGAATAAAGTPLGPGGSPEGTAAAAARARTVREVAVASSRRFSPPGLDGGAAPLGVDARACIDHGIAPAYAEHALPRVHDAPVAVRLLQVPPPAVAEALSALLYGLESEAAAEAVSP
jgi:hypothetical protein